MKISCRIIDNIDTRLMRAPDLVEDGPVWTEEAPLPVRLEAHMPGLALAPGVRIQPVLVSAGEPSVGRGGEDGVIQTRLTWAESCVYIVTDIFTESGAKQL